MEQRKLNGLGRCTLYLIRFWVVGINQSRIAHRSH